MFEDKEDLPTEFDKIEVKILFINIYLLHKI